jgi:hypothetical protein
MKHIKTFESFSSVNEEFLGLDRLWDKAKGAVSAWADRKKKEAAEGLLKAIDDKKDDPEMQKALADLKVAAQNITPEDKDIIASFAEGDIPNIPEGPEDAEVKELVESLKSQKLMRESIQMILEEEGLAAKIVKYFGLSTGCISLITLIITVIKIAIAGSGYPVWLFGLSLGTLGGILMGATFLLGMIGGVGAAFDEEESRPAPPSGNYVPRRRR